MSRRIFSILAVIGMVASLVNAGGWVGPENLTVLTWLSFVLLLLFQVWPLQATMRGSFGHPQHPVNRFYTWLSFLGIAGTVLLLLVALARPNPLLIAIAASAMFIGIMGAAVLAIFATPWREWYTRQH